MEGATPTAGGMTVYLKAGPDGETVGDCPFAQYVRMVLEEKGLPYAVRPCTAETKPSWLVEHYEGRTPALRHRSECYTESDVAAEYLEFFFPEPALGPAADDLDDKDDYRGAKETASTLFPAVAGYLKHTPDGDDDDVALRERLEQTLRTLEDRLTSTSSSSSTTFFAGNGERPTLIDCALAPKLYHMRVGVKRLKGNSIDFENDFPALTKYMDTMFARESFQESSYPEEIIVWGWSNARGD